MSSFSRLNHQLIHNQFLAGSVIFFISLIVFSYLQFYNGITDPDAFYHVKLTLLMSQQGLVTDFPWMQFSTWKDGFVDHHFLYHFLMIPFVDLLPPLIGGKIFQIILSSLAFLSFFHLLRVIRVKYAFHFTLLLFLCPALLFRLSLIKAQPLSLIILFIGLSFIFQKKYLHLFLASLIYVLSYGGWIMLPGAAVIMAGVSALNDAFLSGGPFQSRRLSWIKKFLADSIRSFFSRDNLLLIFSSLGGAAAGLIINPFFPQNINFYWVHIIKIGIVNYQSKIGVGAEWYPYGFGDLIKNTLVPFCLAIISLTFFIRYFKQAGRENKFLAVFFLFFLFLTFKSRRNIEYLIPVALAFSACSINLFSQGSEPQKDIVPIKNLAAKMVPDSGWPRQLFRISCVILIAVAFSFSLIHTKRSVVASSHHYTKYEGASDYLKSHSQRGDLVFNGSWSDFPMLFYYNDANYYVIGLDPTFMYLYDKDLQQKMIDLTLGKRYEQAYDIIKNGLKAKYVQVSVSNPGFRSLLENNFMFKKVYEDGEGYIYQVL